MTTHTKALQLILFTAEGQSPRTLLKDALAYNPGYRAGDVIHLVGESQQPGQASPGSQYVVLSAKYVVLLGDAGAEATEHVLLVEVAELTDVEQESATHLLHLV